MKPMSEVIAAFQLASRFIRQDYEDGQCDGARLEADVSSLQVAAYNVGVRRAAEWIRVAGQEKFAVEIEDLLLPIGLDGKHPIGRVGGPA